MTLTFNIHLLLFTELVVYINKVSRSKFYSFYPNFDSLYLRVCVTDNCTFVFE